MATDLTTLTVGGGDVTRCVLEANLKGRIVFISYTPMLEKDTGSCEQSYKAGDWMN